MTTTTDNDLRDLLWRAGLSPGEIETHMANPYARVYAKLFLDELHRRIAERLAERLIERMFPEGVGDEQVR